MPLWAPAATRHRLPFGVPSLRDRLRRPFGKLVQETATGNQPAGIHAGMPIADPSPCGGSLRSRCCLFRLIFAPRILWGAKMAGVLLSGSGFAAIGFSSPSAPAGNGES